MRPTTSSPPPVRETPDVASSTEDYASRFAGPVGAYFLAVQAATVRSLLPRANQCRVLDVGGGHAQLAAPLVADGYDVTVLGSDVSCRERLDHLVGETNYTFRQGNLLDLPYETASFDTVLAFRMLPHLDGWRRLVAEISRVARNAIILDYPDRRSANWLADRLFAVKKKIEKNTRRYRCFSRHEIVDELQQHGYRVQAAHPQFFFPMALHRLVGSAFLSRMSERVAGTVGLTRKLGSPVILHAVRPSSSS